MSVTEKLMAPGQFTVQLDKTIVPNTIINQLDAWGNIVIVPADLNVTEFSDATLLGAASYVGILYALEIGDEENVVLTGQGMVAYLGSSDSTGMPIAETGGPTGVRSYSNETLENVLDTTGTPKGLLRDESGNQGPIRKGTITDTGTNYTGKHYTESALKAIKYVCQEVGAEFKISTTGLLSAGPSSSIFAGHSSNPTSIIVRNQSGEDPNITGLTTTSLVAQYDASEFVNKVELVASKFGYEANYGAATASSNPYKDIFGTALKRTQYISDPQTPNTSRNQRASAYLNELNEIKKTLNVSLQEYDIAGDFEVGDKIFIHDPDIGFVDTEADRVAESRSNLFETIYQGQILNPTKIRILGITWPVKNGYGVFYRKSDGSYIELTDYMLFETGDVQLEIGDVAPSLSESLSFSGYTLDTVGGEDKSVPNTPSSLSQVAGTYTDGNGVSKAFIKLSWTAPTNTDGSVITDGAYYRVRFKAKADSLSNNINDSTGSQVTDYQFQTVTFGTTEFVIYDLSPNTFYEVGVQAVDQSGFTSSFASISSVQTPRDGSAPNKPDTFATIASNPLRVQFIHNLGQAKNDAGSAVSPVVNFTLAKDIDHLNIYASTTSGFDLGYNSTTKKVTNSSFKIGELKATHSHITNGIPTVGYVDLDNATTHFFRCTAVDSSGNESEPSDEQSGNAELVNTAHIANLAVTEALIANAAITNAKIATAAIGTANIQDAAITNAKINDLNATKINAGTISADRIASGSIDASKLNFTPISGSNVVATINASSEGLTIDADTLNLTGVVNVGDAINIGSGSTSFHVDSSGNMFLGATTLGSAPFKVTAAGVVTATNYTLTGGTINQPAIELATDTGTSAPTSASSSALKIGTSTLFERSNKLFSSKPFVVFPDGDEDNPSLTISGDYDEMGFFVSNSTDFGGFSTFSASNGDDDIFSFNTLSTQFNVKGNLSVEGNTLTVNGDSGSNNQFLGKDSSGNLGYHNISTGSHGHTESDISDIGSHSHSTTSSWLTDAHGTHVSTSSAVTSLTASGTSGSVTGDITIDSNAGGGGFISGNPTRSGNTINIGASVNGFIGQATPHGSTRKIGISSSNRFNNIYSASFFGTFYGLNINASSKNIKENIEDTALGLDFLNDLEVKDFTMIDTDTFGSQKYTGFIAEDVQKYLDDNGLDYKLTEDYRDKYEYKDSCSHPIVPDPQDEDQTITYMHDTVEECEAYMPDENRHPHLYFNNFVGPLVKAVQELSTKVEDLTARIEVLEG